MDLLEKNYEIYEELAAYFSNQLRIEINSGHIMDAILILLGDKEDVEHPVNVWDIVIDYDKALLLLKSFDFSILFNQVNSNSILPKEVMFATKVRVKANNLIWIIHAYDADPFPSCPHAHELDQNIKLDLSNGDFYRKTKLLGRIKKKDLLDLRLEIKKRFKGNLPELQI